MVLPLSTAHDTHLLADGIVDVRTMRGEKLLASAIDSSSFIYDSLVVHLDIIILS